MSYQLWVKSRPGLAVVGLKAFLSCAGRLDDLAGFPSLVPHYRQKKVAMSRDVSAGGAGSAKGGLRHFGCGEDRRFLRPALDRK